jgi:hypothetical protein
VAIHHPNCACASTGASTSACPTSGVATSFRPDGQTRWSLNFSQHLPTTGLRKASTPSAIDEEASRSLPHACDTIAYRTGLPPLPNDHKIRPISTNRESKHLLHHGRITLPEGRTAIVDNL